MSSSVLKAALVRPNGTIEVVENLDGNPHEWARSKGFGQVDIPLANGRYERRHGSIKETTGPSAHPWCTRWEDERGLVLHIDLHEGQTLD